MQNLVAFPGYLSFVLRLLLVFGIGFLLPVFLVLLNLVGVFSGRRMSRYRPWIVLGIFLFAAVATPTGDPITMLLLAVPMWVLFEAAVVVCRLIDRRRRARGAAEDFSGLDDDAASAL